MFISTLIFLTKLLQFLVFSLNFKLFVKQYCLKKYLLVFQIENLLLGSDGKLKLCDFGSATTQVYQPNNSWTAQQRSLLEDEVIF